MAIDKNTAIEVINEYNAGEFEDHIELPDDETELIYKATKLYEEAKKAFASGMRDNAIQGMIWIGDSATIGDPAERTDLPRRSSGGISEQDEREAESYVAGGNAEHIQALKSADPIPSVVEREHLPIPAHIEGDPDPMPRDLSADNVTDKMIRKLSGEYNAYLTRVTYLLGIESADLSMAEHLLEAERARTLRGLDLQDPNSTTNKQKLAKVIDAEILEDPKVTEYTAAVAKHQQMVIFLKSLKEIYSGNVDRLSREWTMRQNEWEKSRK